MNEPELGSAGTDSFLKDQEPVLRERMSIILWMGFILMPLFSILDYLLYPEYLGRFFTYRIIAACCCLGLLAINRNWDLGYKSFYLGMAAYYVVGISIIAMIVDAGGFATPYYAGLSLVFLGFSTVLTVGFKQFAIHSLILYSLYIASVLLLNRPDQVNLFIGNNMFIASSLIIVLVAAYANHRLRFNEYLARSELREAQAKLKRYSLSLESSVAESEAKYRHVVENASEAIVIYQDEFPRFFNKKALEVFGCSSQEFPSRSLFESIHPDDRQKVFDRQRKRLRGERLRQLDEFRILDRNGKEKWLQTSAVVVDWEGKQAILSMINDITESILAQREIKELEERLLQAEKMEAMGTLAGGIAHDFNNLLMGIQGNASLALLKTDQSDPNYEKIINIERYVESGTDLTKQLLGFARGGQYDVKPSDLNEIVEKSSQMFGRTKKEITIYTKLQENISTVEVDQGQIEQVLLNLYVNAWQAMPAGGELYLRTENVVLDKSYLKPYGLQAGKYVKMSVSDTGVGMDKATTGRIFNPFFTTKEMGRGTGLGLATVYGVIKNHSGIIDVRSEKGRGSTFTIYLPASQKTPIKEKIAIGEIKRGSETILFVDDEEMIIEVGQELLMTLGYEVLIARGGKEALEIYKNEPGSIDLIILDIVMPDLGGGETYDKLKEINPGVKVLLSSGYSIKGNAKEIMDRGCNGFIQKPFKLKDLSQKLREVLEDNETLPYARTG